ncbi:MAG: L,D-transpeptidase family protein [Haliea sp.]|nr:L,D-transpeptidase family protein [Haliea sp.]
MFPNEHMVYPHDTPSRDLFSRSERTFSSGCIRVEEVLELAQFLLDDPRMGPGGDRQRYRSGRNQAGLPAPADTGYLGGLDGGGAGDPGRCISSAILTCATTR